jgi:hypothetical protein
LCCIRRCVNLYYHRRLCPSFLGVNYKQVSPAQFYPSNKDSVNSALHECILSSHHGAHRIAVLHPSTNDSSDGALHDVPLPIMEPHSGRRCPSYLRMHDNQLSPRSSPSTKCSLNRALDHDVNSPFISPGPVHRSYHDVLSHFTSHGPVRLSKLFNSSELEVFHRIERASSSPFATSHFPHFLFFTVCVLQSCLFVCWFAFFGVGSFVCLLSMAFLHLLVSFSEQLEY